MITWGQIIVVIVSILICAGTVALCDIKIIGEIKKLRTMIQKLLRKGIR